MNKPNYTQAASFLAEQIVEQFSLRKTLYVSASEFHVFTEFARESGDKIIKNEQDKSVKLNFSDEVLIGNPFTILDEIDEKFHFVVGDLPLGMMDVTRWTDTNSNISIRTKRNWLMILKALLLLDESGFGLFTIEPAFWTRQWSEFQKQLNSVGFFVEAIFNPIESILPSSITLQPNLVLISRKKRDEIFIAEIEGVGSVGLLIDNLINKNSTNNLSEGVFTNPDNFRSFDHYKITKQIERLQTQYKEYSNYKLADISLEVNLGNYKQKFVEKDNSIYIPRLGSSPVIVGLENLKIKDQNYVQVVLDETIVLNKYLKIFFSSKLGQLVLESLHSGLVIPRINKTDLVSVEIPVPPLKEQKILLSTEEKLTSLTKVIESFKGELSLNPRSAVNIQEKVLDLLEQLNLLTDSDKVLALIRQGESKTLEFKQTLSLDVRKQTKEKYIEKAVLKTIVGFLNSDGGILLVGISDDGEVQGLSDEVTKFHKNYDKLLLHFKNLIKSQVGEQFYQDINYRLVVINSKTILFVECTPANKPCFLEQKEFYVRTNPATDLLEGPKLVEYINRRFSN